MDLITQGRPGDESQSLNGNQYIDYGGDVKPSSMNISGYTWINWTWNNPPDVDFDYTMVYLDGVWKTNTSDTFYNAMGLNPDTYYTISTRTVDINGNVNETWVNQTAKTKAVPEPTPTPTPSPTPSPTPCFIATAAYGTPLHEDIDVLRDFRDNYLMTNSFGRSFVRTYYATSPPIADVIRDNEGLKTVVREGMVKPLVYISRVFVR